VNHEPQRFTVPAARSDDRPLTGAAVIPPDLMESVRRRLERERVDALVAADGPLSAADRKTLQEELLRAREQYRTARARIRAITGRLAP